MHLSDGYPAGPMSLHYGGHVGYHPGHTPVHASGHAEGVSGPGLGLGQGVAGAPGGHEAVTLSGAPGMDPLILPSTGVLHRHLVSQYVDSDASA